MRSWSGPQPNSAFLYLTAMDAMYKARPHPRSAALLLQHDPIVTSADRHVASSRALISLAVEHAALPCWQGLWGLMRSCGTGYALRVKYTFGMMRPLADEPGSAGQPRHAVPD